MSNPATVTQEKWDSLSERDQLILSKMGITVAKPSQTKTLGTKNPVSVARRLSYLHTAPAEYFMQVVSHCECCDGVAEKFGKMTLLQPRDRSLAFVEQEIPEGADVKMKRLFPVNCPKCVSRLSQLSVDELVQKVMFLTTQAVMKGWL